ncbi:DUF6603 domain-containing protein [Sorangium sp. So ce394]|uniref:DUF6603 domain-containing protein n=1 Tax=Sorangium sp. So ce394 TaxID=3133310 RepID=UPI003F5B076A
MSDGTASQLLQTLLTSLSQAQASDPNHALPLTPPTLRGTAGAHLLDVFQLLQLTGFTLTSNVSLPASVTSNVLVVSGQGQDLTLTVTFEDLGNGDVAIEALFQAPALATITGMFGAALPSGFYSGIVTSGPSPTVQVPGLAAALTFASAVYGLVGVAAPQSGLMTYALVPQIQGDVSPPSGAKGLSVALSTATSGYELGPVDGQSWSFDDLAWLLPSGLNLLAAFPAIIGTTGLGLRSFGLSLWPSAPLLSNVTLDVADTSDPSKALWTAAGGKIALTDVVVSLGLDYTQAGQGVALGLSGSGYVQGNFVLGSLTLEAEIPFPLDQGVWSLTAQPNIALPDLGDIAHLLSGGSMDSLLPAGLSKVGGFTFRYLRVAVAAQGFALQEFTFALSSTSPWPLLPSNGLTLSSLQIQFTIDAQNGVLGTVGGMFAIGEAGQVLVEFGRSASTAPWRLDVISPVIALPSIGEMATLANGADLGSYIRASGLDRLHFLIQNLNLGLTVSPTALTNLGMTIALASAADPLTPTLDWEVIPGVLTLTEFSVGFQLAWSPSLTAVVQGAFTANGLTFEVGFGRGGGSDAFVAAYTHGADAGTIDVKQLIATISPSVASILPDGLVIDVADALLAYVNANGAKKYLFAMDIAVEFPLSSLPLVGKALPADAMVGIKNLKLVVTSDAFTAADVAAVNQLMADLQVPVKPLPPTSAAAGTQAIPKGFSMVAELALGSLSLLVTSPPPAPPPSALAATATPAATALAGAAAPGSDVMWIDVQKTFGPVTFQKIGFSYQRGSLFVLTNMALAAGGLEIDLLGLGIGSPIESPRVELTIQGIAVSFQEGPISIQGGLLGTLSPVNFVGALSVRVPELALAAFAGYAEYQDHPSFFLYGILNAPLGGIPAFFVTGAAVGFGFNRQLVIPDVSGVASFPLVAWATGGNDPPTMDPTQPIRGQVQGVLTRLASSGVVAPSVGDYWLAAGLSFTSFTIVDSFALATVTFGKTFEVALLGISTLQIPPESPVAEVQIALEVSFSPSTGLLAIAGQLTPSSYILSKDARLTGGFAFNLWFSGERAGETVLTFGGYNPNFTVPSYYPAVPRLGLSWRMPPALSIVGGLYFALTNNVVMAGGQLSATWESGPVRAWFTVWADFLLQFKPFHYFIDAGIDLGASFSVKIWFVRVSFTVHVGVGIQIWGPSFAGKATVDLSIISFTISFGTSSQDKSTKVPWHEFVSDVLPGPSSASSQAARPRGRFARPGASRRLGSGVRAGTSLGDPATSPLVRFTVSQGLVRVLDDTPSAPVYLVNGETFRGNVKTVIPIKTSTFSGQVSLAPDSEQPRDTQGNVIVPNVAFGAGPAGIGNADFQPGLTLAVQSSELSTFHAVRALVNAPKAFWELKTFDANGVPVVDPGTALTSSTIVNALGGYDLVPVVTPPDTTLPVPLETLLFTLDDDIQPFSWTSAVIPTTDPFTTETVAQTIATRTVDTVRSALIAAMAGQGVTVDPNVDVTSLSDPANDDLDAAPRLRLLGEMRST